MSTFQTTQFTGGMNNVISPDLLDAKTAVWLSDACIDNGKLTPMKNSVPLDTTPVNLGHYGNRNRSVVKWYDRIYWSENIAPFGYGHPDGSEALGIPMMQNLPTLTAVAPATGETGLTGTFSYCMTWLNPNGWEGAPSLDTVVEQSIEIELENQFVTLSPNGDWPDGIAKARVYRTTNNGADFYLVGTLEKTTSNPTPSMTDKTTDTELVMLTDMDAWDNYPPAFLSADETTREYGKFLTESGGVFFLAVGSRLYFSVQNNPHAWPRLNFIGFDDTITGIVPEFQGVLVFTKNSSCRVTGADNINTVTKSVIPGNQGCASFRSIAQLDNAPVWLSYDGICMWNGESLTVISQGVIETKGLAVRYAVACNEVYYLFLQDGTLCYDQKNGGVFYRLSQSCDYAWYDDETDKLYLVVLGTASNVVYDFGAGSRSLSIKYVSPHIHPGNTMLQTRFTDVIIVTGGSATFTFSVEGRDPCVTLSVPAGRTRFKLPRSAVGRYAQVTVTGGALNELAIVL